MRNIEDIVRGSIARLTRVTLALAATLAAAAGGAAAASLDDLPAVAGAAKVAIPSSGVMLGGYLYWPAQHGRSVPAVLLLHAAGGSAQTLSDAARVLLDRGYAALALSMRGAPGSEGDPGCGSEGAQDAVEALRWLARQPGIDPSRLGVLGFGEGGQAALLAAAAVPTLKAVVAFSPITEPEGLKYASGSVALRRRLKEQCGSADAAAISPMAHVAEISAPVLLIHGQRDEVVPPSQSEMLYNRLQALNKASELRELPDADDRLEPEEAERAWSWVATFLGRHQLRAAATRSADQQERVNTFTERGWNLPLNRDLKSLRAVGKVVKQTVSTTQNPYVSGRLDEVRELWFDGLYLQVLIPGRKKDFLLQEVEISKSRYKVLFGLRIGAERHSVETLLGPADVHGADFLEYMNAAGVGTARIYLKDDRIAKIEWEYRAD